MCGIFGAVNLKGDFQRKDYDQFTRLTDLVHYRGPDAGGYSPVDLHGGQVDSPGRFQVFLGHRRLAIIDLDTRSNQPLFDGPELAITFNGEIFDYVELRKELAALGHDFRTESDTEVILKIYRQFGEQGFRRMNGMWAFAILDRKRWRLILSRDRFSIKPLYYTWTSRGIVFGSEIKQLLPLLEQQAINLPMLHTYLDQGLVDHTDATLYERINCLKPRHNLVLDLRTGQSEQTAYWDYETDPDAQLPASAVVEKFRYLFTDSVRIRLRSDVKIAALVSGGLDSSSIVAVAKQFHGGIETYSAVAADKAFSEERFIRILCDALNVRNTRMSLESDNVIHHLQQAIYHNDEPFTDLSAVAHYLLLRKLRQESDAIVLLSGQGGDETLMGYLKYFYFYLGHLVRTGKPWRAISEALYSLANGTALRQFSIQEARRYLPFMASRQLSYLRRTGRPEPIWEARDLYRRQIADIERYSVPALTHYEDRNSMAHSQEIRLPFLDHRLVNFATSLPPSHKVRHGWSKYILRQALPELPADIRWRRDKKWFLTPEKQWLVNSLKPLIYRCFERSVLSDLGVIDSKAFLKHYENFQKGDWSANYSDISRTLLAELWVRGNTAFVKNDELIAAGMH